MLLVKVEVYQGRPFHTRLPFFIKEVECQLNGSNFCYLSSLAPLEYVGVLVYLPADDIKKINVEKLIS